MLRTAAFGEGNGTVTSFDEPSGLGEIVAADGSVYPFQCTGIADGTRTIAVGRQVTFTIVAGHLGKLEATNIA